MHPLGFFIITAIFAVSTVAFADEKIEIFDAYYSCYSHSTEAVSKCRETCSKAYHEATRKDAKTLCHYPAIAKRAIANNSDARIRALFQDFKQCAQDVERFQKQCCHDLYKDNYNNVAKDFLKWKRQNKKLSEQSATNQKLTGQLQKRQRGLLNKKNDLERKIASAEKELEDLRTQAKKLANEQAKLENELGPTRDKVYMYRKGKGICDGLAQQEFRK